MPTPTPPLDRPRTRRLARKHALHDARVLTRIRKANLAAFRDEAGVQLPSEKGGKWQQVGTVRDDDGGPLAGARVHVAPAGTPPFVSERPEPDAALKARP